MGIESTRSTFTKAGFILLYGLTVLLWIVPLVRCAEFYNYASRLYHETNSINSYNDYAYSRNLAFCYLAGFGTSTYLVWLLHRTKNKGLFVLMSLSTGTTAAIIHINPENVIVLFSLFPCFFFTVVYLMLAAIGTSVALPNIEYGT